MSDQTTPEIFGQTQLDTEAESMIREISDEFKYVNPQDPVPEPAQATPASPTELENTVPAPESPVPAPPVQKSDQKGEEWGPERLISREFDLRKAREEFEAEKRAWAEAKSRDTFDSDLAVNATEALRARGHDPEQLVRRLIAEKMGDRAPDELKSAVKESEREARLTSEIKKLQARLDAQDAQAANAQFIARVQSGAREYVTTGIDSEQFPTLSRIAKANPDRVHREIMEEISRDAAFRAAREPNGEPLPPGEAAKRVEARWKDLASFFTSGSDSASTPGPNQTIPKTHADGKSPTQPSNPGVPKPPDRPLAPWLQKVDVEEEGIRAALAEFRKLEGR